RKLQLRPLVGREIQPLEVVDAQSNQPTLARVLTVVLFVIHVLPIRVRPRGPDPDRPNAGQTLSHRCLHEKLYSEKLTCRRGKLKRRSFSLPTPAAGPTHKHASNHVPRPN